MEVVRKPWCKRCGRNLLETSSIQRSRFATSQGPFLEALTSEATVPLSLCIYTLPVHSLRPSNLYNTTSFLYCYITLYTVMSPHATDTHPLSDYTAQGLPRLEAQYQQYSVLLPPQQIRPQAQPRNGTQARLQRGSGSQVRGTIQHRGRYRPRLSASNKMRGEGLSRSQHDRRDMTPQHGWDMTSPQVPDRIPPQIPDRTPIRAPVRISPQQLNRTPPQTPHRTPPRVTNRMQAQDLSLTPPQTRTITQFPLPCGLGTEYQQPRNGFPTNQHQMEDALQTIRESIQDLQKRQDERFEKMEKRQDDRWKKMEKMEKHQNDRWEKMKTRQDTMHDQINSMVEQLDKLSVSQAQLDQARFDVVANIMTTVQQLAENLGTVQIQVSSLMKAQSRVRSSVAGARGQNRHSINFVEDRTAAFVASQSINSTALNIPHSNGQNKPEYDGSSNECVLQNITPINLTEATDDVLHTYNPDGKNDQ